MDQLDPSAFAKADSLVDPSGRQRDSLFLLAQLHIEGRVEPIEVRVRNLSAGGLMAELPYPVRNDRAIEIDVRGLGRVPGRIAWQTAGRAGIAFDEPVDPQRARKPVGGADVAKPRGPRAPRRGS